MTMKGRILLGLAVAAGLTGPLAGPLAAQEVNLYSNRTPELINPLLAEFTKQTGVKVNIVHMTSGMLERLRAEGANTPADAVLTADVSRIDQLASADLLQPIKSATIEKNVPAVFRQKDGLWTALTSRARVAYVSKTRVKAGELKTYEDLADPKWKGKVCTRSGKHEYNIGLLAAMIAAKGEAAAEQWARGVKANLARKPLGGDRDQVKAILDGVCDVALGNTYYMGLMATNEKEPEQKQWAASANIVFPTFSGKGTQVNVSAAGITKHAKNRDNAVKLLEFLSGDNAQKLYAEVNYEYPVKPGVEPSAIVKSWGTFTPQEVNLETVAKNWAAASRIMDKVDFDS
jgi:iron(III) transport system substrate-binding protein